MKKRINALLFIIILASVIIIGSVINLIYFKEVEPRLSIGDIEVTIGGLVAHYPMDGNLNDVSGNSYNGVCSGTRCSESLPSPSPSNGPGYDGSGAYYFDGINDGGVIINDGPLKRINPNGFAASVWFKTLDGTGRIFERLYGNFEISFQSSNSVTCRIRNSASTFFSVTSNPLTNPINLNQWYHAVCSFDPVTKKLALYLNGTKIAETSATNFDYFTHLDTTETGIGFRAPNIAQGHFKGYIDDMQFYNKMLSDQEVINLYSYPKCSDSDGGTNYYNKGVINIEYINNTLVNAKEQDYCASSTSLAEYNCVNSKTQPIQKNYYDCSPNVCFNGACSIPPEGIPNLNLLTTNSVTSGTTKNTILGNYNVQAIDVVKGSYIINGETVNLQTVGGVYEKCYYLKDGACFRVSSITCGTGCTAYFSIEATR